MRRLLFSLAWVVAFANSAIAQDLQTILQTHAEEVAKPSRNSVGVVLQDLEASGLPQVSVFLEQWAERNIWQNDDNNLFFIGVENDDTLTLTDVDSGEETSAPSDGFTQLRPNGCLLYTSPSPRDS